MISYREEYFRSFIKEDILKTSSFKALYKKVDEVNFFGPSLDKEDEIDFDNSLLIVLENSGNTT